LILNVKIANIVLVHLFTRPYQMECSGGKHRIRNPEAVVSSPPHDTSKQRKSQDLGHGIFISVHIFNFSCRNL